MAESKMTKEEILLAQSEHLFPCVFHYYKEPLVISHAKNQYIWDADGNQYLDFFGGIVTVSVGHCNEDVNRKVHAQMDRLQHVSTVFVNEPQAALAKKLAQITPAGKLTKSFFTSSGTEANETAILAARCYTGSTEIVALRYAYHGRSSLAMGLTAQSTWRLGPVTQAGIVHAVNAYCYRCPYGLSYPSCEVRCAQDVGEVIRTTTSGRIAGFIAEPIQGVAGFVTPPKEYFPIVAEIVKKHGGVFISDEVQTAWGRTGGKWFGIEQWGVQPDIITSAKGLANGSPIGLTIARPEIADSVPRRHHFHLRRQPDRHHGGQRGDRFHRGTQALDQRRGGGRVFSRQATRAASQASHHRRRARHGAAAGHRAGGGSGEQDAGGGANPGRYGSSARKRNHASARADCKATSCASRRRSTSAKGTWTSSRGCWMQVWCGLRRWPRYRIGSKDHGRTSFL